MRTIDIQLGAYDRAATLFQVLSAEFDIAPPISTVGELEAVIRRSGELRVEIRYADEPYGEAAAARDGERLRSASTAF